ncbi:MAG: dimethyl sulfoxide reductase anchor subunit [Alphaproteobacteria bacterium]|nr:dimethyl sulfoxide reductase anchor subunit [Alphaproteobacteria bacterium]
MNPAYSVIFFTTASGAGYGLLTWLGVAVLFFDLPAHRWFGLAAFAVALALITGGLLASTFHLGHPERAWRGLTQWRSSWLAREGVVAVATYIPAGLAAIGWVFLARNDGIWSWLIAAAALLAVATVLCTAMIYQSLRAIPRWNNSWVLPVYLAMALASGALLFHFGVRTFGLGFVGSGWLAAFLTIVAWAIKLAYWRSIDGVAPRATAESATGLGHLGKVRLFEAPHTGDNYLTREMGYKIARKHARQLRMIALILGGAIPIILAALATQLPDVAAALVALFAAISASAGLLVERWLFFAEAVHTVSLYYGTEAA